MDDLETTGQPRKVPTPEESIFAEFELAGEPRKLPSPEESIFAQFELAGQPRKVPTPEESIFAEFELAGEPRKLPSPEESIFAQFELAGQPNPNRDTSEEPQRYSPLKDVGLFVEETAREFKHAITEQPKRVQGGLLHMGADHEAAAREDVHDLRRAEPGTPQHRQALEYAKRQDPEFEARLLDHAKRLELALGPPVQVEGAPDVNSLDPEALALQTGMSAEEMLQDIGPQNSDKLRDRGNALLDEVSQAMEGRKQQRIEENPRYFDERFTDNASLARLGTSMAPSLPGMMVAMVNPVAGSALMTAQESVPAYAEMRNNGFSPQDAAAMTAAHAAGTFALEKLPFDIGDKIKKSGLGRRFGPKAATGLAVLASGASESGTEVTQELWQWATENGFKGDFEQFKQEVDMVEVALSSFLMGSGISTTSELMQHVAKKAAESAPEYQEDIAPENEATYITGGTQTIGAPQEQVEAPAQAQAPAIQEQSEQDQADQQWRQKVEEPLVNARKKILETIAAQKLSEVDHPIARVQHRVIKNRYGKSKGKWGIKQDQSMDPALWEELPQNMKNNKTGFTYEEILEMHQEVDGERAESGLSMESQADDVLRMLSIPRKAEDGNPNFVPQEVHQQLEEMDRYYQPELNRELMEETPVSEVLYRMDPEQSQGEAPMLVQPSELEDGDILRLGEDLYEVQQRGDIKVLQDGSTIPLDEFGGSPVPVDGVVPVGHPMHQELREAYELYHQQAGEGVASQQAQQPAQGDESLYDANQELDEAAFDEGWAEYDPYGRPTKKPAEAELQHAVKINVEPIVNGLRQVFGSDQVRKVVGMFLNKPIQNDQTGMEASVSKSTLKKMMSPSAVNKSFSPQAHMLVMGNLDTLFEVSRRTKERPDRDGNPHIKGMHHFVTTLNYNDQEIGVKFLVKEMSEQEQGNRIYTIQAVEIEDPTSFLNGEPQSSTVLVGPQSNVSGKKGSVNSQSDTKHHGGGVPTASLPKASLVPDWTLKPATTKKGKTLVRGTEARGKQSKGLGDIVQFVNDLVKVEMRRSRSQTSNKHPAHYRPVGHLTMTRNTQSQINFHEAGHGLKEMLEERMGARNIFVMPGVERSLLKLTERPGSMASAKNVHEGVAEWVRLKIVNPRAVEGSALSYAMEQALQEYMPGTLAGLQDATRAYHRFMNQPAAQRWANFNKANKANNGFSEFKHAVLRFGEKAGDGLVSGGPVSRLDRKLNRQAYKQYKQQGDDSRKAAAKMRENRKRTKELVEAHNILLQIGAETQLAFSGKGPAKGIRYFNREGHVERLTNKSWTDIIKGIPNQYYHQFEQAGWALEHLNRWKEKQLEYPGMREGITPDDLQDIVNQAKKEIPDFQRHFNEVQAYFDALLELRERSGMLEPGEKARIQSRDTYWPLPRVMNSPAGHKGTSGADFSTGLRQARGSAEATLDLNTAAEMYTRRAFSSVYWNQFAVQMFQNLRSMATDKKVPEGVRHMAGRQMTPLTMPMEKKADVNYNWILSKAYDAVAQNIATESGQSLQQVKEWFKPSDMDVTTEFEQIFRPSRPKDVNVLSFVQDGKRQYVQMGDPALFNMFTSPKGVHGVTKVWQFLTANASNNVKRAITQNLLFAFRNVIRDATSQMLMSTDKIGRVPAGATYLGLVNRFTKKYPEVQQEGLLLSRTQPGQKEMVQKLSQSSAINFLAEGFYLPEHDNTTARWVMAFLNPGNWVNVPVKAVDVLNLAGGKQLNALLESASREGAAIAVLKNGGTQREAELAYWNVTGPFNEHSSDPNIRAFMNSAMFVNPAIQSINRQQNLLFKDPDPKIRLEAWAKVGAIGAASAATAAIRYLLMDEEDRRKELERPFHDRMRYHDVAGFRIPFPYGLEGAAAKFSYNAVMDGLLEREEKEGRKQAVELIQTAVGLGGPENFLGPQLKTFAETKMNYSIYQQRHIVAPWLVNLPKSEQYKASTPEFYKKIGEWGNWSPSKVEYFVENALSRQLDEMVHLIDDRVKGKPIQEKADIPFIGGMFIREPTGWGSQSVQDLSMVDARMKQLDRRLNAMGWGWIKKAPLEDIPSRELYQLRIQMDQLQQLRKAVDQLPRYSRLAKAYREGERHSEAHNVRKAMTMHAQAALMSNQSALDQLDQVIDMLEEIGDAPPEVKEWDYRRRAGLPQE